MSSMADVVAMSHFGKTVESKLTVLFPVTLSGVSSFGIPYEDLSFVGITKKFNLFKVIGW